MVDKKKKATKPAGDTSCIYDLAKKNPAKAIEEVYRTLLVAQRGFISQLSAIEKNQREFNHKISAVEKNRSEDNRRVNEAVAQCAVLQKTIVGQA